MAPVTETRLTERLMNGAILVLKIASIFFF